MILFIIMFILFCAVQERFRCKKTHCNLVGKSVLGEVC